MIFSSVLFILYFLPAALLLYYACSFSRIVQNVCLLMLSLVFYAWGEPLHLIPMLYAVFVTYGLGLLLTKEKPAAYRKTVITTAVVLLVGMLLLVKYGATVSEEIAALTGLPVAFKTPGAPLGVSFFTLQALAYIFDVSRGKVERDKNIINVGLYIALFPTVLAGPVLRYANIARQITDRKSSLAHFGNGTARFVTGLFKLVVLASPLSLIANNVFIMSAVGNQAFDVPVTLAWLGLFAFGLQVYLAFSAYSDMAIGLGSMFGFTIGENFRYPYTALSVTDFWNRWHISLFQWFYTYVYIALGGARPKPVRIRGQIKQRNFVVRNFFIMWLLIGLWHGITWPLFLWGMWFFFLYTLEWIIRLPQRNISSPFWHVYLLLVVGIGWVFFRSHSFGESMNYFANMLGMTDNGFTSPLAMLFIKENWLPFFLGIMFCTPVGNTAEQLIHNGKTGLARYPMAVAYIAILAGMFCLSLIYLTRTGHIPFVFA